MGKLVVRMHDMHGVHARGKEVCREVGECKARGIAGGWAVVLEWFG